MRTLLSLCAAALLLPATLPAQTLTPEHTASLEWRLLGPSMPAGRAWTVTGVESDPKTLYVTTAGGGLWKTTNHGTTFQNVFTDYGSASTGAVAVAPSNSDIVWVGTGEPAKRNVRRWLRRAGIAVVAGIVVYLLGANLVLLIFFSSSTGSRVAASG